MPTMTTNTNVRLVPAAKSREITLAKRGLLEEFGWHEADLDGMRFDAILAAYKKAQEEAWA